MDRADIPSDRELYDMSEDELRRLVSQLYFSDDVFAFETERPAARFRKILSNYREGGTPIKHESPRCAPGGYAWVYIGASDAPNCTFCGSTVTVERNKIEPPDDSDQDDEG